MDKKFFEKKLLLAVGVSLLIGGLIGVIGSAPVAKANIFGDFFRSLFKPLLPATSSLPGSSSVPEAKIKTEPYRPTIDYEEAVIAAIKKTSPAVVSIVVSKDLPVIEQCPFNPFSDLSPDIQDFFGDQFPQFYQPCQKGTKRQQVGGGSGFIISSDGLVLTNKHVVADKKAEYIVLTNDGKKYSAEILARDPVQDLAVLKINPSTPLGINKFAILELGDSDSLQLGQTAIAIGNALGEFRNTVSVGVISGLARTITASGAGIGEETLADVIQTDAAINPGNSGGPLLNLQGQVIGTNTAVVSGAENIGFAIPINQAKRAINSVKRSGKILTPYLGVRYLLITPEIAENQKLSVDYGALLRETEDGPAVAPNSPADKTGLRAKDIILEINNIKIDQDHPLANIINRYSVGDTITLKINRGGQIINLSAKLEERLINE